MIIKLTGIDTAGKSTLAARLEDHGFDRRYHHYHHDHQDLYGHYVTQIADVGDSDQTWDRGFITEHVYGPVLRAGSRLRDEQFVELLRQVAGLPALVVFVWEDPETIAQRLRASSEDPIHALVLTHLDQILARYEDVLTDVGDHLTLLRYRPSRDDITVILDAASRLRA